MKVLCQREHLREALATVNSVIPQKSARPAVENVYFSATERGLELVGTDLEISLRYRLDDVQVLEPGVVLAPARVAAEFVRDLSSDTVGLTRSADKLVITGGSDRCELVTVDPDEFPVVPRFEEQGTWRLQGGTFTRLVNRTAFATAREQGRYAMHGILVLLEEGKLGMIATDGRRLAVAHQPIDDTGNNAAPRRAIVPTKAMQMFSRVIHDPLESVSLHISDNQIGLRTSRVETFARLIDGEFPRYVGVIPTNTTNSVEADCETFLRKLRLVSNVTSTDTRAVRLAFSKDQMEIHARSTSCGEANAQMEVKFSGKGSEIAFNPDYVMEGLKNCESGQVVLEFSEKTSPGKFRLGEDYTYVVMPITTDT